MKPDAEFSCPTCGGKGCPSCNDTGAWTLTECPHDFVGHDLSEAMRFADLAREGAWPKAGGTLDQTAWMLDFCKTYWSEVDAVKPKPSI